MLCEWEYCVYWAASLKSGELTGPDRKIDGPAGTWTRGGFGSTNWNNKKKQQSPVFLFFSKKKKRGGILLKHLCAPTRVTLFVSSLTTFTLHQEANNKVSKGGVLCGHCHNLSLLGKSLFFSLLIFIGRLKDSFANWDISFFQKIQFFCFSSATTQNYTHKLSRWQPNESFICLSILNPLLVYY